MAKISKPPVPVKLYKHFAAVTIVLTGAIAMFADEDQRAPQRTPSDSSSIHNGKSSLINDLFETADNKTQDHRHRFSPRPGCYPGKFR